VMTVWSLVPPGQAQQRTEMPSRVHPLRVAPPDARTTNPRPRTDDQGRTTSASAGDPVGGEDGAVLDQRGPALLATVVQPGRHLHIEGHRAAYTLDYPQPLVGTSPDYGI
jgi:hypothetical protein